MRECFEKIWKSAQGNARLLLYEDVWQVGLGLPKALLESLDVKAIA